MGERGKYALFFLFFTTRSEKGHKRRGCEEMRIHFFTAPFMLISSLFLPTIPANQDYSLKRNVSLSLLSYRHPERSRGIFVAAALLFPLLIRLHEAPYPTFMEYQASRFRSHTYTD